MKPHVFLSASIPLKNRHEAFWSTADNVAIREAVMALTAEIIHGEGVLVFGGHPAITPLVSLMFERMNKSTNEHVILYQCELWAEEFPKENQFFPRQVVTETIGDGGLSHKPTRDASLLHMRTRMFEENTFTSAIFIGGMEGIIEEHDLLSKMQPDVSMYPLASTGAASKILYRELNYDNTDLATELTYSTLFRKLLAPDGV